MHETEVVKEINSSTLLRGYRLAAIIIRVAFAALFLIAAMNAAESAVTNLAEDLAMVGSFQNLSERELLSHMYSFVLAAVFTLSGTFLLTARFVRHTYLVMTGLYVTFTIWQIATGTLPQSAGQYIPTIFGLLVGQLLEAKGRASDPVAVVKQNEAA